MKILPEDLPVEWHVRMVQLRDSAVKLDREIPQPRAGLLGRMWSAGSELPTERIPALLPAGALSQWAATMLGWGGAATSFLVSLLLAIEAGAPVALVPLATAPFLLLGLVGGNYMFRKLNSKPVSPEEVKTILERVEDPVTRAYLELVRDAAMLPGSPDTETNVRAAIQALGEAVAQLPVFRATPLDTGALRAEASALLEQANTETDRVTSESLSRRAAAIHHRLTAHEHAAVLARRADALGAEILAQVAAVREGLAALQAPRTASGVLASVAQAARQVATEASGVAAARQEIESTSGTWPATPQEETAAAVQRLG